MLPVPRAVEVFDQPTLRRRGAHPGAARRRRARRQILEGLSADERTDIVQQMGEHERRRLLPKLSPRTRGPRWSACCSTPTTRRAAS